MNRNRQERQVAEIRRFGRFYTHKLGLLERAFLDSPFSLSEARVIYELAQREVSTAAVLAAELDLDPGYLSRLLKRLRQQQLVQTEPSPTDGREVLLRLSPEGEEAFALLNRRADEQVLTLLEDLSPVERQVIARSMNTIRRLLGDRLHEPAPYLLRPPQPGDMGWVIYRHGVLYAREYGWDERFEALVAEIVADFANLRDLEAERCWIAERNGQNVGSVFLVRRSDTVAQLRLLLVEPEARGMGIGTRLVEECVRFARQAGYKKVSLWTNDVLKAARHIYEKTGFTRVEAKPHRSFGRDLVGETWELTLVP